MESGGTAEDSVVDPVVYGSKVGDWSSTSVENRVVSTGTTTVVLWSDVTVAFANVWTIEYESYCTVGYVDLWSIAHSINALL